MVTEDEQPEPEQSGFNPICLEMRLVANGEAFRTLSILIRGPNELIKIESPDGGTLMAPFEDKIISEMIKDD